MPEPKIRYCRTSDGVAIAYTVVGEGPPLLYARRFMAPGVDDELTFSFSQWGPLARVRSVVLWDMRGTGLSEVVPQASFDDWIHDMEAVVAALGVDRVDLGAELTPCHFAIAFAARHPDKVGRVVLWNPTHAGFSPRTRQPAWLRELAGIDWDAFADVSTHRMFGWRRAEAGARFAERLRKNFTRESYERTMDAVESVDTCHLAPSVRAPVLVVADESFFMPHEESQAERHTFIRKLAADIPAAELAVIKPGDVEGSGRTAVRFLEPSAGEPDEEAAGGGTAGATAVIMFADIADSTALTESLGDAAFREKARALDDALRATVRANGGAVIDAKTLGDGILATFPAASQAIAAGLRCAEEGSNAGLPLHVGLHAGDVIRESDNVFGGAVNIAARISSLAQPGEVLVSRTVADLGRTSAGVTFEDRGEPELKGVAEPVRVYAVHREA
jgi:class 3 adenylate cyclase/pimeloyl-ACP methyl ester carboxylesterase